MSPPVLTAEHLARWGACVPEVARFAVCYSGGLPVTIESAELARAEGFSVLWLAKVFPASVLVEYERVRTQALAKYERAKASAWAERALAWTEYQAVRALAWTEYERTVAPALVSALVSCWDEIGGAK